MVGFGNRTDGIDGAPHGQGPPIGVSQGEIHGAAGAVGGRGCRIKAGLGPEAGHGLHHGLPGRCIGVLWIQAPGTTFLGDAVLHHEPLHRNGSPGIEDRQTPALRPRGQGGIGREQPRDHAGPQPEGAGPGPVGSAQAHVGVGLQPPQAGGQRLQRFAALLDRDRAPGASRGHGGGRVLEPACYGAPKNDGSSDRRPERPPGPMACPAVLRRYCRSGNQGNGTSKPCRFAGSN